MVWPQAALAGWCDVCAREVYLLGPPLERTAWRKLRRRVRMFLAPVHWPGTWHHLDGDDQHAARPDLDRGCYLLEPHPLSQADQ